jgi:hypothetical protein
VVRAPADWVDVCEQLQDYLALLEMHVYGVKGNKETADTKLEEKGRQGRDGADVDTDTTRVPDEAKLGGAVASYCAAVPPEALARLARRDHVRHDRKPSGGAFTDRRYQDDGPSMHDQQSTSGEGTYEEGSAVSGSSKPKRPPNLVRLFQERLGNLSVWEPDKGRKRSDDSESLPDTKTDWTYYENQVRSNPAGATYTCSSTPPDLCNLSADRYHRRQSINFDGWLESLPDVDRMLPVVCPSASPPHALITDVPDNRTALPTGLPSASQLHPSNPWAPSVSARTGPTQTSLAHWSKSYLAPGTLLPTPPGLAALMAGFDSAAPVTVIGSVVPTATTPTTGVKVTTTALPLPTSAREGGGRNTLPSVPGTTRIVEAVTSATSTGNTMTSVPASTSTSGGAMSTFLTREELEAFRLRSEMDGRWR